MVQWKFINVCELYKLSALIDGAELYSRVQEADNAGLYIELVHKKAANIRSNITHRFLQIILKKAKGKEAYSLTMGSINPANHTN